MIEEHATGHLARTTQSCKSHEKQRRVRSCHRPVETGGRDDRTQCGDLDCRISVENL